MENFNNVPALPAGSILRSPIAQYEIVRVIGSGGFGITYLATSVTRVGNIPVKFKVAIKEHFPKTDCERRADSQGIAYSAPAASRYNGSLRNFLAEARRLQELSGANPNIVNVNEVFEANGTAYYVMEYLEGQSLKSEISASGPMKPERAMEVMRPVISAVALLHGRKIMHLDIKPDNIMLAVEENGRQRPVLIDFGLSKHFNPDGSVTSSIGLNGVSDGFTPIEQYAGVTKFSPASDVYSLAATMLYALSGEVLPAAAEVNDAVLRNYLPATVNQNVARLLVSALSFRIPDRPTDASVFGRMLDEAFDKTVSAGNTIGSLVNPVVPPVKPGLAQMDERTQKDERTQIYVPKMTPPGPPASGGGAVPPSNPGQRPSNPGQRQQSQRNSSPGESEEPRKSRKGLIVLIILLLCAAGGAAYWWYENEYSSSSVDDETEYSDDEGISEAGSGTSAYETDPPVQPGDPTPVPPGYEAVHSQGYYDMIFNQLKPGSGVKKMVWYGQTFTFDREGKWTNAEYTESTLGTRSWNLEYGKRVKEFYTGSGDYLSGSKEYTWDGDRITKVRDEMQGNTVLWTYDENDRIVSQVTEYDDSTRLDKKYQFTYKLDDHGNWVSRSDGKNTMKRTIEYYD